MKTESLIRLLAALTFLVFFQAFMVAPLLPALALEFKVDPEKMGTIIPAYLFPYGIATLFYGLLSDHFGRRRIMLLSLISFVVFTLLTTRSSSSTELLLWRFLTGLGASGIVPLALALIGSSYPMNQRGRPLGWLFGAMAGGMAFGSSFGLFLEPYLGWRGLFGACSLCGALLLVGLFRFRNSLDLDSGKSQLTLSGVFKGYAGLIGTTRGARTYACVFVNAIFHSGVYTWLGLYLRDRHHLTEPQTGFALLGYGVPGFLLGPLLGRWVDRAGRAHLLPAGIAISSLSAFLLIPQTSVALAALAVTALSLGYDMSQPLLAGIVTSLDPKRAGQAMGLNVFFLFSGLGIGSIAFSNLLFRFGMNQSLLIFGLFELAMASLGVLMFSKERPGAEFSKPSVNAARQ
jgi:predicted MFS family arabinose efflux permease